jgi:hypothetical protein
MEALDALAVAARDILARTPAPRRTRENRARAGDSARYARREHVPPFQSARETVCGVSYRTFHVETACEAYISLVD